MPIARKHPLQQQQEQQQQQQQQIVESKSSSGPVTAHLVHVDQIPDFYRLYLSEEQVLARIKAESKAQKTKMKALIEYIKEQLGQIDKSKTLFYVPKEKEQQFGMCAGLRLAKRSRTEVFSEKRMEEVAINATCTVLQSHNIPIPVDMFPLIGKKISDEMLSARKVDVKYDIARVMPKGASAANPNKRAKKEVL